MRKVLFITYYWPPAGGPGVQRFYYFAKKIRQFGWEPVIYTVKDGTYFALDHNLEKELPPNIEVLKKEAFEPHKFYNMMMGKDKNAKISNSIVSNKKGFLQSLMVYIRGNFFIPDARMFWIKPSIKYLNIYLKTHKIDAIVSTSPPQSIHLIAKEISKLNKIPWIADFRDPWTNISYFEDLNLSSYARKKHIKLEKSVLNNADIVVTVTPSWNSDFKKLGAKNVETITNGFDEEFLIPDLHPNKDKFTITYMGSLPFNRNPTMFWKAIKNLINKDTVFKSKLNIQLIGNVSKKIIDYLIENGLKNYLEVIPYVEHKEVYNYYKKADVLLLIGIPNINGVIPGKVFEYLYAQKPIFSIGPEKSDVVDLLKKTKMGLNIDFNNELKTFDNLNKFWQHYTNNELNTVFKSEPNVLKKYSRIETTKQLVRLLNEIT